MNISKSIILAGAVALSVLAQPAAAAGIDVGQSFIDRVSGAEAPSTAGGRALTPVATSAQPRPNDFYGLAGSGAAADRFERTQGQGMGERAGAVRR